MDNGISILMNKIGGYSYYLNKKYQRIGTLFQDRYKAKLIKTENQLRNNFVYICTNPVSIIERGWKKWRVENPKKAINFLENKYRWGSYWDYIGKPNFPKVTNREFFLELFRGEKGIKNEIDSWINFKSETLKGFIEDSETIKNLIFE